MQLQFKNKALSIDALTKILKKIYISDMVLMRHQRNQFEHNFHKMVRFNFFFFNTWAILTQNSWIWLQHESILKVSSYISCTCLELNLAHRDVHAPENASLNDWQILSRKEFTYAVMLGHHLCIKSCTFITEWGTYCYKPCDLGQRMQGPALTKEPQLHWRCISMIW